MAKTMRRWRVFVAAAAVGSGVAAAPLATAAPAPCSVSALAAATSSVSNAVSGYLEQHPDVNQELSDIAKLPTVQARPAFRAYFGEHPEVATDLRGLRGPLAALDQCGFQVAPGQLVAALETL